MMVRVIYRDQTAGVVESHLLDELINKGRIVAYHGRGRWIPVHGNSACGEGVVAGVAERIRGRRGYEAR